MLMRTPHRGFGQSVTAARLQWSLWLPSSLRILPQSLPLQSAHFKHQVYVLLRHPLFEQVIKRHPRPRQKSAPDVAGHLDFFRLVCLTHDVPTSQTRGRAGSSVMVNEALPAGYLSAERGEAMFRHACAIGLEGVVSKRATSRPALARAG